MVQKPTIMKKVTIFKSAILALLACVGIVACDKSSDVVPEEPEVYTVNLGWEGEILDVSYEPLATRATTDDLYGIQVYSAPDNDAATPTWTKFAYGVFDDPDNITINLLKGYKYKFVATMVKDGKNRVGSNVVGYFSPFYVSNAPAELNKFNFSAQYGLDGLGIGNTNLKNPKGIYFRPNTERFYGELVDYVPGANGNKAKIHMKRTSFKAKFIAKGKLAKSGTLNIMMTEAPEMNLELSSNNQISDMFTFSDVDAAWADNQYSETIDVTLTWTRTDGTVVPLNTHKVNFKRNATTVVKVTIENDANAGELGFEIDDTPITEGDDANPDVEITDGESVKTNVSTNH